MSRSSPESSLPFVSVVVPVRNGKATIGACIRSLLAGSYPAERREIIVVDNASTDRTARRVQLEPVIYVHEPRRGVSYARNRGIEEGRGEIVAFLDGDCVASESWLTELVRPFEDPRVGCVAGELDHLPAQSAAERQTARMLGRWQRFAISADPPFVVTANAAFRREVLEQLGGFDTTLPRAQDVDLGLRFSRDTSYELVFSAGAVASHAHHRTQLGFFRQQLGWAYGAGLVEAKNRARGESPHDPPKLRPVGIQLRGLGLVIAARLRGRGRHEFLEDAWFNLLRQVAAFLGGWAGLLRGRRRRRRRGA
ncbi:MAG: glycosyltransferase [Solirubrobacterales bacterium]